MNLLLFGIFIIGILVVPQSFANIHYDEEKIREGFDASCARDIFLHLPYNITSGSIEKICTDGIGYSMFMLLDVSSNGYMTIKVPNDVIFSDNFYSLNSNFAQPNYMNPDPHKRYFLGITDEDRGDLIGTFNGKIFPYPRHGNEEMTESTFTVFERYFYPENQKPDDLIACIVDFDETYTIYKIPFLKDDVVLSMRSEHSLREQPRIPESVLEKYSQPIDIDSSYPPSHYTCSSCRDGLVPMINYHYNNSVCVKPTTAETLIERGWGFYN